MQEKSRKVTEPAELVGVYTTTASKSDAERLATLLIESRLAACVQIEGPIQSVYRWEERIESAEEWRLLVKTPERLTDEVCGALLENHPYEEPEILLFQFHAGSPGYVTWAQQQVLPP